MQDVANDAGVSPATVSRVLSKSDYPVSDVTRDKVVQAADRLSFRPNLLARGLVTSKTQTLGAIAHDISDPYFGEIVRGLEDAAREAGYRLFVCSSDRDPEREYSYVDTLLAQRVDALVFAGGGIEDEAYRSKVGKLLADFVDRDGVCVALAPTSHDHVIDAAPDNQGGAAQVTRHLIELGHESIGFIGGPGHIRTALVRRAGYEQELAAAGLAPDSDLIVDGGFTVQAGRAAAERLLSTCPDITAIQAANDLMACGALQALAARGLRVPDDVSVAGYDDTQMAGCVVPALTTVHAGMYELGAVGARLALAALDGGGPTAVTPPVPELVVRGSTSKVRA